MKPAIGSRPITAVVSTILALGALLASAAPARAGPSTLVAAAHGSGSGDLASGFDAGVPEPKKMVLKVKLHPNVKIELEYDVFCFGSGDEGEYEKHRQTPSRRIDLDLPIDKPRGCLVYVFARYDSLSNGTVRFRIELRSKERGH